MEWPILLCVSDLVKPIRSAVDRVGEIELARKQLCARSDLALQGLFALAVANLEVAVVKTLEYYLRWLPRKLPESRRAERELRPGDDVDALVERYLLDLAYKSKQNLLPEALEILSISDPPLPEHLRESIAEACERRNLLLHRDLTVDERYRDRLCIRAAPYPGMKLEVDDAYLDRILQSQRLALETIALRLQSKYKSRTFVAAVKALWKFTLDTPMARFDDWWEVVPGSDTIRLKPDPKTRKSLMLNLSHSERMFAGMWLAHYLGRAEDLGEFSMATLGGESKARMLFFLSVIGEMRIGGRQ